MSTTITALETGHAADHDVLGGSETGAASAEYAAVTACGVGIAGVLMKLLTSDFGQALLEKVLNFFLSMIGIG